MIEGEDPGFEVRTADWLSPASAQAWIQDRARPLPPERVTLVESLGRALAEDIHADVTLPPWDNAGMDGYAARAEDLAGAGPGSPVVLRVVGVARAGGAPTAPVMSGEAVRIMTGAPLPPGADSVVRVEDTDGEARPGLVSVLRSRDALGNVREGGKDARPGDHVLSSGQSIHPGTIGVLAALGRAHVMVGRRPQVALLTTGDELRDLEHYDDVRSGAGIPESNGPMLVAAVASTGGIAHHLGIVSDTLPALTAALGRATFADALVTVGGASMGEADLVKRALDAAGFRQDFWRVRMRPGSPFSFGWLPRPDGDLPVFGLPGNPASAFVTFEVFVRPFLLRLAGHQHVYRRRITCEAGEDLAGSKRTLFLRVTVERTESLPVVRLTGPQGSGLVRSLAATQGLAMIPAGRPLQKGSPVQVLLLDEGPAAASAPPLGGVEA
jgi:molybdopterin molybdotransferase